MYKMFKFLLRPTSRQVGYMTAMVEDHRALYNAALEERRTAWRTRRISVRYGMQSAQLKDIRRDDPDGQGRWGFSSQQATLRRLDRTFNDFYRRVKAGKKPGYPRFKGRRQFNTVIWPKDGDGVRWDSQPERSDTRIYFKGVGHVRVHQHRPIEGRIKDISLKREYGRWYVVLCCDNVPARTEKATGAVVGIDMGVASLVTTSDGTTVENPKFGRKAADKLARALRMRDRRKKGSNRRRKAAERANLIYAKVRRQRLDYAHKVANGLVADYDLIVHEKLNIEAMTKRPAPLPNGDGSFAPNRASVKASLNLSIMDAGWGVLLTVLAYKAESAGREVVAVNPRNTSRTCPECGHCAQENRPTQALFKCLRCGHSAHADHVAARNILGVGLALRAASS